MAEGIFITLAQANGIAGLLMAAVNSGTLSQASLDPYRILINPPNVVVMPRVIELTSYVAGSVTHLAALCDDGSMWDFYNDGSATLWHPLPVPLTSTTTIAPPGSLGTSDAQQTLQVQSPVAATQLIRVANGVVQSALSDSSATQTLSVV